MVAPMAQSAPVTAPDVPVIAVAAVAAKISNHQGNFFLQYFPNMCKSGSPEGEPLLFLSIYCKLTEVFHSDCIMLLTKAVSAAFNYVEFGIRIGLLCLTGVIKFYNAVLGSVGYKNRTCIGFDLSNWIEIDHIFYIAPAQLHRTAVDDLRDILGIKLGKHHFACTGIIGDAQCGIEQHQLVHKTGMLCRCER